MVKGMLWISGIIPNPDRGTILYKFFGSVPDPTVEDRTGKVLNFFQKALEIK
jgi:hypothetical protein